MNLVSILYKTVRKYSQKMALIQGDERLTFSDLWQKVEVIGNAFHMLGLKEGNKVVIILPNCIEFIFCFFATLRNNLIAIPLKHELTSHELKYMMEDSKPDAIITFSDYLSKVEDLIISTRNVFVVNGSFKSKKNYYNCFSFEELYKMGTYNKLFKKTITKNLTVASINYTYNGKGIPLGAMLTHGNYIHAAVGYIKLLEIVSEIRLLLLLPMCHVFGLMGGVIVPLLVGGTVVIEEGLKPTKIFHNIELFNINLIIGTPGIYLLLLEYYNKQKYNLYSLKYGISGGSYMSSEVSEEIERKMSLKILQGYGLTECFPIICNTKRKNVEGSLGIPGHRVKAKIDGKDNEQIGELMISSPTTMLGYYNQPEISKEVLKNDCFYTGDYAEIDAMTGHIMFRGIKKNIAKVNGNTVDITEVYNVFLSHPAILDVRLYRKDTISGQILTSEVLVNSSYITEKDLRIFLKTKLASYKIPKAIKIKYKESINIHGII